METFFEDIRLLRLGEVMVKAENFWGHLCNKLNYRFFSGVPCKGLDNLYNKMSSSFMHYIPAANEQIAVGMVNGASLTSTKAAVLMDISKVNKVDLDFNIKNSMAILIIAAGIEKYKLDKDIYSLDLTEDYVSCLDRITKHIVNKAKPGVLFIGEGVLV